VKIRVHGLDEECRAAVAALTCTPGLTIVSVDGPRADRGASVLVRCYIEARLSRLSAAERVTGVGPSGGGR
jgi:hypothetical protein